MMLTVALVILPLGEGWAACVLWQSEQETCLLSAELSFSPLFQPIEASRPSSGLCLPALSSGWTDTFSILYPTAPGLTEKLTVRVVAVLAVIALLFPACDPP